MHIREPPNPNPQTNDITKQLSRDAGALPLARPLGRPRPRPQLARAPPRLSGAGGGGGGGLLNPPQSHRRARHDVRGGGGLTEDFRGSLQGSPQDHGQTWSVPGTKHGTLCSCRGWKVRRGRWEAGGSPAALRGAWERNGFGDGEAAEGTRLTRLRFPFSKEDFIYF